MDDSDENASRRADEWEALQAVYDGDDGIFLLADNIADANEKHMTTRWTIELGRTRLQMLLPATYPSQDPPQVSVYAPHLANERLWQIQQELIDLWAPDTEVALLWTEHCRAAVEEAEQDSESGIVTTEEKSDETQRSGNEGSDGHTPHNKQSSSGVISFVPSTSRFGQPIRNFEAAVVLNNEYQRKIFRGEPFHPPKSGPSETLLAFCAAVTCHEHVQWVLAELLLNDNKVAKASHNMFAYRFTNNDQGGMVSDNDDDGEKGSGAKLAALLELAGAQNVMVIVSRWYGGVHLGPARFKWIASTAREALEKAGFIGK